MGRLEVVGASFRKAKRFRRGVRGRVGFSWFFFSSPVLSMRI